MRNPTVGVLDHTDELSRQTQRVTAALRPRPEVAWCDTFATVEHLTADAAPFDVLVAGPLVADEDGFQQLRRLRERHPDTRLILAVDHWASGSIRDTVRTGAVDILRLPVDDQELLEAVEQALGLRPTVGLPVGDEATPGDGRATVIAVVAATGGCGKTFFATNLAYQLQSRFHRRACLMDLDLQFGELSTALRLKPKYTISDLAAQDVDHDELVQRLEDHLIHHDSGIHLLAAPSDPADADAVEAGDLTRVIEAARTRFDYVVIDTGAALSDSALAVLDQADEIYAVATLDLPSVRTLGILLSTLQKLKVPKERVKLLLNKVEPDVGIDVAGVSQYFPQGFSMVIPYGREVNRALNMGQPVLAYAPGGDVSRSLDAGLRRTLGLGDDVDGHGAARPARSSRLSTLRWRFGQGNGKPA